MARSDYLFTSESVSEGHPDKVSDRISDEVVDLFFREGPKEGMSPWDIRAACETLCTTNRVIIAGETRGPKSVGAEEVEAVARAAIKDIGYEQEGFHWKNAQVEVLLHAQSAHIAQGVDASGNKDEGAGDQGIMFGYACRETPALMPAPLFTATKSSNCWPTRAMPARSRRCCPTPKARSRCAMRTVFRWKRPRSCSPPSMPMKTRPRADIRKIVEPYIRQALPADGSTTNTVWHINPTGSFVIGGPDGDCGLTGRKIIVDTYGGAAPHGGGAFSGKDSTKVDRSAAYAARYLAKNVVASGLADRCTIQLAYAIGVAEPLSVYVDTHGTGKVDEARLEKLLPQLMSLKPRGIREHLGLNKPIYARTSAYGHFGREPDSEGGFSWEKTDLADQLKAAV